MTKETRATKNALAKARHAVLEAQCELLKTRDGKDNGKTFVEREEAHDLIQELRRVQLLIAEYEEKL